jgi:16S rRNA (adenine(1408)-N(1))-methyltransferase
MARANPRRLFVGIDANAEAMREGSRRAGAKASRGGVPNALFVHMGASSLPEELAGVANGLSVLFPWGSLLAGVVAPDEGLLAGLRALCDRGARLEIVVGFDPSRDATSFAASGAPVPSDGHLGVQLPGAYARAGFHVSARELSRADLARYPTTWAKRLGFTEERRFFVIEGEARNPGSL